MAKVSFSVFFRWVLVVATFLSTSPTTVSSSNVRYNTELTKKVHSKRGRSETRPLTKTAANDAFFSSRNEKESHYVAARISSGGDQDGKPLVTLTTKQVIAFGALLAFNAGYMNGACLSGFLSSTGTKQATSAVTGSWTTSAISLRGGNTDTFVFTTSIILSYFGGSLISGLLYPDPVPKGSDFYVDKKAVGTAFLIGAALTTVSSALVGESPYIASANPRTFFYLLTIAAGIQNSITSSITSNLVRSAHFSGITSDMGTFLGQVLRGNKQNYMKLKTFAVLALFFWAGGFISFEVSKQYVGTSLLFSSLLYLALAVGALLS